MSGKMVMAFLAAVALACGGAITEPIGSGTDPSEQGLSVAVFPEEAAVATGETVAFAALVTGSAETGVSWSVEEGNAGGFVTTAGLFTAPATEGTYHVVARSQADATKSATAVVTVTAEPPSPPPSVPTGVSVLDYGARGDGVTNDTAAFNAAIAAAKGGTVVVPGPNTYLVSNVAVNVAGTRIECTGSGTATPPGPSVANTATLRLPVSSSTASMFRVTANNVTFRNCVLDGQRTSQTCPGILPNVFERQPKGAIWAGSPSYTTFIELDGLTIQNTRFQNFCGLAIASADVSNVSITDSYFTNLGAGALFASSPKLSPQKGQAVWRSGLTFSRNYAHDANSAGTSVNYMCNMVLIAMYDTVYIEDNDLANSQLDALKIETSRNVFIRRNTMANHGHGPGNYPCISLQGHALSHLVAGNTITDCGKGISVNPGNGAMPTLGYKNVTISGNTLSNVYGWENANAIVFTATTDLTDILIENNTVTNTAGMGIRVKQYSTTAPVANITVRNNNATAVQQAISLENDSVAPTGISVTGNTGTSTGSYGCYRYGKWGTFISWAGNTCSSSL